MWHYHHFIIMVAIITAVSSVEHDVVIIGAGLSGLGAGKYLTEQKMNNFIILEAQDYIGGRVKTTEFANETVSLGAGWIHEADETNTLYRLANKYSLKRFNDSYTNVGFRYKHNGSDIPLTIVRKRRKELVDAYESGVELAEEKIERDGSSVSMETGLQLAGYYKTNPVNHALSYFLFDFENGVSPMEVDSISCGITGEAHDQVVTDDRGYLYPVYNETKLFHQKIKLSTVVKKIEHLPKGSFKITTSNGTVYNAKFVLVTVSTGVLLANDISFSPPLPDWKIKSLKMTPMVHYCKIFLRFSEPFWDVGKNYIMFVTMFNEEYIHWQNFELNGLSKGKNVLLATLTGTVCQESTLLDDEEIKNQAYESLKKVYTNASKPLEMVRSKFSTNPFVRGAYSNQVPGISENDYKALEHPVQQKLFFAGEYLGRWEYGYAHEAYDIGMNAAKNLTLCMKDRNCASDKPSFSEKCPAVGNANLLGVSYVGVAVTLVVSLSLPFL